MVRRQACTAGSAACGLVRVRLCYAAVLAACQVRSRLEQWAEWPRQAEQARRLGRPCLHAELPQRRGGALHALPPLSGLPDGAQTGCRQISGVPVRAHLCAQTEDIRARMAHQPQRTCALCTCAPRKSSVTMVQCMSRGAARVPGPQRRHSAACPPCSCHHHSTAASEDMRCPLPLGPQAGHGP